jgi:phenylalanyl-tRNA synthetase beta chain
VGELHPEVSAGFEIDAPCAILELDLSALEKLTAAIPVAEEISRQPCVTRDIAVLLDREQPAGEVLEAIEKSAGRDLASAAIFDRYEGKGVPEGRVSLAFRLIFQRADRTLKDSEVVKATDRVVRMISHRFRGELR